MTAFALLLAGYSVFSALAIALTHFRGGQPGDPYRGEPLSRFMGLALLAALAGLQAAHFAELHLDGQAVGSAAYRIALFVVAPAFYLFSRPLLSPRERPAGGAAQGLHFLPVMAAPLLPAALAQPAAFLLGAGYLAWLGRRLLALRRERARFAAEITLLGLAFCIALAVAVAGLLPAWLPDRLFIGLYASAIGLAFLLVQVTLNLRPQLPAEVQEAAQAAYVNTTLAKVDCDAAIARLAALMAAERLFIDPQLSLAGLAARLGLSAHQLSELLNSRLGKSFARYVRELRIEAAKAMLSDEPSASVLSVGLSVGFTSQSNFYEAFREIEGTTPGQYRKLHPRPSAPG